jgi:2-polyprenyl-6-methoxyphenol hydroxylase-like FAD-dependent oxidoreductase
MCDLDVVVGGGGISGLAVANGLVRAGWVGPNLNESTE